jgi:hypothetical protein
MKSSTNLNLLQCHQSSVAFAQRFVNDAELSPPDSLLDREIAKPEFGILHDLTL